MLLVGLGRIAEDSAYVPSFGGGGDSQLTPRKLSKHTQMMQASASSGGAGSSSSRFEKRSDAGASTHSNMSGESF